MQKFLVIISLIASLILVALFLTQKDTLTILKTDSEKLLNKLGDFYDKQNFILEEIKSIHSSVSNLNINIKDKTLILAEHNMRLNEMEYYVKEVFLKSQINKSNNFTKGEVEPDKFFIEKIKDSNSFFPEIAEVEIEEMNYDIDSSDASDKTFEEKIIYFLSPDDYLSYKNSFVDSQEYTRLSDFIGRISGNANTPLSLQQKVKLTIAAFEESGKIRQTYGNDYNIPVKDFDEIMLVRAKDFLSDSQFSALKEFVE